MAHRMEMAARLGTFLIIIPLICGVKLPKLEISGQKVFDQLLHLATFSDDPNPAVTRILFTGGGVEVPALHHNSISDT